jgi:hypothetical protein
MLEISIGEEPEHDRHRWLREYPKVLGGEIVTDEAGFHQPVEAIRQWRRSEDGLVRYLVRVPTDLSALLVAGRASMSFAYIPPRSEIGVMHDPEL